MKNVSNDKNFDLQQIVVDNKSDLVDLLNAETNKRPTVAVAMSGGVDSAVVAGLMQAKGYKAFGITAKMTQEHSRCCADEDICRAANMCSQLGMEHHVVDVCDAFQADVIDPFMDSYIGGETPSPCVNCNNKIKFGVLLEKAVELGADVLATGHYAQLTDNDGIICLERGVDTRKDQSYFLARLTQEQLRQSMFPLGGLHKSEVSQMAADFNLEARKSRESQDLCFVTEETHGEWIDLRSFDTAGAGDIVDRDGNVVGRHRGIHHYTIGQRKGLGIAMGHPVYVIGIDPEKNQVIIGERKYTQGREALLHNVLWSEAGLTANPNLMCQVRYNHLSSPCKVDVSDNGDVTAIFEEPQFAITPGQLAVFYDGNRVVGSGWIVDREKG